MNLITKAIVTASTKIVGIAKHVSENSNDASTKERLMNGARMVAEATRNLVTGNFS